MTKTEKLDLQWKVRYMLGEGKTDGIIISKLMQLGFQKATIKNYIKAFKINPTQNKST